MDPHICPCFHLTPHILLLWPPTLIPLLRYLLRTAFPTFLQAAKIYSTSQVLQNLFQTSLGEKAWSFSIWPQSTFAFRFSTWEVFAFCFHVIIYSFLLLLSSRFLFFPGEDVQVILQVFPLAAPSPWDVLFPFIQNDSAYVWTSKTLLGRLRFYGTDPNPIFVPWCDLGRLVTSSLSAQ